MNARQHTDLALDYLPIGSIRPSPFKAQTLRRAHFSTERMIELAASIQANGVLQPILVRPVDPDGTVKYEIVAGERRWIAADRAGIAHIPATVRDMSDDQVLEAQLVENLQREGLQALEEAEGYRELMALTGDNADDIAAKIGKSRSYVYARLKLLDLIPAAREALHDGDLDASSALVIARIKGDKMQARALKIVTEGGAHYSYRRLMDRLRSDTMISLAQAPWLPDGDILQLPKDGGPCQQCSTCPSRSRNDPELAAELGTEADLCLDSACHTLKTKLHWARLRHDYEAQGKTVITGDGVKAVLDTARGYMARDVHNGYIRLDAECSSESLAFPDPEPEQGSDESDDAFEERYSAWCIAAENHPQRTYAELVGDLPDTQIVDTGKGLVAVAPVTSVTKALKAKGIKIPSELRPSRREEDASPADTEADRQRLRAEAAKEEERRRIEQEYRNRLVKAIHAKYKGPLKLPELQAIADTVTDSWHGDVMTELYPDSVDIPKLKEPELLRLMVTHILSQEAEGSSISKPTLALALAQRLRIDPKKIRTEVVKDLKPTAAPGEETEPKKATKKGAKK